MPSTDSFSIRSFILAVYDRDLKVLRSFKLPIPVAAPFANRMARELLNIPDWSSALREPWFMLLCRAGPGFQRSARPAGPTDLYGRQYDPSGETGPEVKFHPEAVIRSLVVRLYDFQNELCSGEYSVDDVFLHSARYLVEHAIEKGKLPGGRAPYHYQVIPSEEPVDTVSSDLVPEDAYEVEGVFRLPPRVKDEPRTSFRRLPPAPFPICDPATRGVTESRGKGDPQAGRIRIPERIYTDLHARLQLSTEHEEGGFVLGNVFRLPGSPENEDEPGYRWLVEITDLLMGENTVGTPLKLLFTHDTWAKARREQDRRYPDRQQLGWFHTHVFPATDTFGLSGLDQNMHRWFLSRPWQIAILLNLEDDGRRTVRCYQRGPQGDLEETPYEIF